MARRLGLCRNSHGPCLLTTSPTGVATLRRLSTGNLYRVPLPDMPPSACSTPFAAAVWRSFELDDGEEPRTYELAVFKLDLATEDLVQIKDLRGHALFVSFFVSVNEFPVLTPNCVYLAHDSTKCRRFKHIAKEVRVYNLQDDTFADQYTQSSWKNCPPPALWFQPTWSLNK
ncbi:hypothetical protein OsI_01695 [Oryza sativa Indica Group]|uniref:KIB1-4 beta-propeller domain-containing protein n=1 Tax=Oryza sativa subsp. indica TaxID=39946 RepID=B8A7J1_ORYSI|nr:hypothetical protein OsI_01695 [Oryza sativa Indica Group]